MLVHLLRSSCTPTVLDTGRWLSISCRWIREINILFAASGHQHLATILSGSTSSHLLSSTLARAIWTCWVSKHDYQIAFPFFFFSLFRSFPGKTGHSLLILIDGVVLRTFASCAFSRFGAVERLLSVRVAWMRKKKWGRKWKMGYWNATR